MVKLIKYTKYIPNSMTLFNIAVGIAAVLLSLSGETQKAAGLIIVSVIVDCFDGYIARMFNYTSKFGSYLDTISDFISFGIAAPILMVKTFNVSLWVAALFTLFSILRLIYFMRTKNPKFFYGLPVTVAGGFLATYAIAHQSIRLLPEQIMIILSVLMVSFPIKYYRIDLRNKKTMTMLLAVFMYLFVLDVVLAVKAVMFLFLSYILLGWLKIREVKS